MVWLFKHDAVSKRRYHNNRDRSQQHCSGIKKKISLDRVEINMVFRQQAIYLGVYVLQQCRTQYDDNWSESCSDTEYSDRWKIVCKVFYEISRRGSHTKNADLHDYNRNAIQQFFKNIIFCKWSKKWVFIKRKFLFVLNSIRAKFYFCELQRE